MPSIPARCLRLAAVRYAGIVRRVFPETLQLWEVSVDVVVQVEPRFHGSDPPFPRMPEIHPTPVGTDGDRWASVTMI
jgi:hypothetical protein